MLESNSYLRPIPEDQSDTASRHSHQHQHRHHHPHHAPPSRYARSEAGSSVRAMQAGHEGSIMSGTSVDGVLAPPEGILPPSATKRRPWYRRTSVLVTTGMMGLVAVAVTLILVLGVGRDDGNSNTSSQVANGDTDNSTTTATSSPSPSAAPTLDPVMIAKLDEMLLSITSESDLRTPGTPQYDARSWMLYTDFLRDDVLADGRAHVLQRYALVTLYHSTGGGVFWNQNLGGVKEDQFECDWLGLDCDPSSNTVNRVNYSSTGLEGSLPSEIGYLSTLQELDLSSNKLSGSIPEAWFTPEAKLQNLFYLDLSNNSLAESIPQRLWECPVLRFVYLHSNRLQGRFQRREAAEVLSPYLEAIWLDENQLTGPLPTWINQATNLDSLFLYNNSFTGVIPDMEGMDYLMFLDVSYNQLTGEIPSSLLYNLPEIRKIFLDENLLEGTIPEAPTSGVNETTAEDAMVASTKLIKLWLQGNGLSGDLPPGFGQHWSLLEELLIYDNPDLSGTIDNCDVLWPDLERLEADCESANAAFPPPVDCTCCTLCNEV